MCEVCMQTQALIASAVIAVPVAATYIKAKRGNTVSKKGKRGRKVEEPTHLVDCPSCQRVQKAIAHEDSLTCKTCHKTYPASVFTPGAVADEEVV